MPGYEKSAAVLEPTSPISTAPTVNNEERDAEKQLHGTPQERSHSTTSTLNASPSDEEGQITSSSEVSKVPPPVKVPRSKRRGLLAQLCFLSEVENSRHFPRNTKWLLTCVVAAGAVAAPLGSAILLPSLGEIGEVFDASPVVVNLAIALYLLALGVFPLWWSFFSETFGRRSVYIVSFSIFIVWNILTAVSTNISMLIVMRVLAGGAAGSVQAVGAGTVSDCWDSNERGGAMGIFYIGPLMGPLLAPIIGGALQEKWGWRSTAWFMVIYGGVFLLSVILVLPETLAQRREVAAELDAEVNNSSSDGAALTRTSTRQTINKGTKKALKGFKMALVDPLLVVKYCRFPAVALCVSYAGVTFATLYILQISIESTFSAMPYNFTAIEVGCSYLFNSVGYLAASYTAGRWNDHIMAREARKARRYDAHGALLVLPEDRMRENAWLAAVMYPCAFLWYGWAAQYHAPWPAVLVANFFFGVGSMIVFGLITTMLTEFMPGRASTGVALNNLCRCSLACVGIFVTQPLLDAVGNGWLFTGLFVISLAAGSVIHFMKKHAPRWRVQMDKALSDEE